MTPAFAAVAEAAVGTWLSPKPGERISTRNVEVAVGYNTESGLQVTRLELWVDGKFYDKKVLVRPESRGVCSFWWDTARTSQGAHELLVKIYAGDELIATVSGTGTVGEGGYDLRPPTVRFANIKSGDVLTGTARIEVVASDDSGEKPIVSMMVDNALKCLTNRPPYVCEVDTTQYSDGSHEIQSFAFDNAGNKSEPATVKVSFKNGSQQPVAAAVASVPEPKTPAPSEDDGAGAVLPPVREGAVDSGAARAVVTVSEVTQPAPVARPVAVAQPKPAPATAGPAGIANIRPVITHPAPSVTVSEPKASKTVAPPSEARPSAVAVSVPISGVRTASARVARDGSPVEPAAPRSISAPREARVGAPGSAAAVPQGRSAVVKVEPMSGSPVEPSGSAIAERAEARMTAPAHAAIRTEARMAVAPPSGSVEPRTISQPVVAAPRTVSAAAVPGGGREVRVARALPSGTAHSPATVFYGKATATAPAPVRVAMLPDLRGVSPDSSAQSWIANPPVDEADSNAKIEKRTVPASGKIKARDLFTSLGGLLFWDPETHTVTAYMSDMVVEMRIGSSLVKVNGKEMKVDTAPIVIDGRTIIDVSLLHQARTLIKAGADQAKAE